MSENGRFAPRGRVVRQIDVAADRVGLRRMRDAAAGEARIEWQEPPVFRPAQTQTRPRCELKIQPCPTGIQRARPRLVEVERGVRGVIGERGRLDTLGLGTNVPIAIGSNSDSLLALQPNGEFAMLRVPYPNGFFAKNVGGRIDDPNGAWKGRSRSCSCTCGSSRVMTGSRGTAKSQFHW